MLLLLGSWAGCSQPQSAGPLQPANLAQVVIGRSSRSDVFTALGRPLRTERSAAGESWVYESKTDDGPSSGLVSGATTAAAAAGAFVPYVGLIGSGIGLANTSRPAPETMDLMVKFGADGIVLDCVQSNTAMPSGLTGSAPNLPPDCTRPAPVLR